MHWIVATKFATVVVLCVLAITFALLWRQHREKQLAYWACAWTAFALLNALGVFLFSSMPQTPFFMTGRQLLANSLVVGHGIFALLGAYSLCSKKVDKRWYGFFLGTLCLSWLSAFAFDSWLGRTLPPAFAAGIMLVAAGIIIGRNAELKGYEQGLAKWGSILWGIHLADAPFNRLLPELMQMGYFLAMLLVMAAGIGQLVVFFHKTRLDMLRAQANLEMAVSGVAHNFNNVLMAISSSAQATLGSLNRKVSNNDPEMLLKNVLRACDTGSDVVKRLSRLVERRPLKPEDFKVVDIGLLLKRLVRMIEGGQLSLESAQPEVSLNIEEKLYSRGVPGEIMEVFINLVRNALEAMPDGGKLHISAWKNHENLQIDFIDSGPGIDPKIMSGIFEPFFTTKGAQGRGLGLAVSKSILASHGGGLQVSSRLNKGSEFRVYLPSSSEPPQIKQRPEYVNGESKLRILLVEDEGLVAAGVKAILENAGHSVVSHRDLSRALEAMETQQPHIIITDLGLPDAEGIEVTRRLRHKAGQTGRATMPIVAVSGWNEGQVLNSAGSKRPWDAYLQKPIKQEELLQLIDQVYKCVADN